MSARCLHNHDVNARLATAFPRGSRTMLRGAASTLGEDTLQQGPRTLSRGAATPLAPTKSMTSTCERRCTGAGQRTPAGMQATIQRERGFKADIPIKLHLLKLSQLS